jgi:Carboxypeptidase regulatory-like domain
MAPLTKAAGFAIAFLLTAAGAWAQLATGALYGHVADESGGAVASARVELIGPTERRAATTGSDGRFRFLALAPASYAVEVSAPGFAAAQRDGLRLNTGQSLELSMTVRVAPVAEAVNVIAAPDPRRLGTATTFTRDELERVPTARDPWALLATVPGVLLDRVNIAGNETGQQTYFRAKGAIGRDAVWTLDGVNITDMASTGLSPTYYDIDAFAEIRVSTAGHDIAQPAPGVGIHFVTKRGTEQFHGTARAFFTADGLQWSNLPDELRAQGVTAAESDHIRQVADYGFELGGPILPRRLWFWASYGKQDVRLVRAAGNFVDKTLLKDFSVKLTAQVGSKDTVEFLWFRGVKQKFGRSVGNAAVEANTALWNQDNAVPGGGPPGLWKAEDHHVFGPNLFLTARYAYYGTGYKLVPTGGSDLQAAISPFQGRTFGSTLAFTQLTPQHSAQADLSWFKSALGGSHELRFGASYRRTGDSLRTEWPGNKIVAYENSASDRRARVTRDGHGLNQTQYWSGFGADTFTRGRLTATLGFRYDLQYGEAKATTVGANPALPELLPGLSFLGYDRPFIWSDLSPRLGVTYALDQSRRTLVHAAHARYVSQLPMAEVSSLNPAASAGFLEYPWADFDGDGFAQAAEVETTTLLGFGGGVDIRNPGAVTPSVNQIDPGLRAPRTSETIVGVARELAGVQVALSWAHRRFDRATSGMRIGYGPADYFPGAEVVAGTLPDGTPYRVETFIPDPSKALANGGATISTNLAGYRRVYDGLELTAARRLAGRWMGRLAASWNSHREYFDGVPSGPSGERTPIVGQALQQGGPFAEATSGSGGGPVYLNARWTLSANAVYQLPRGFEVGASLTGRQGYPKPYYRIVSLGIDGAPPVLVSPRMDSYRFASLWDLDLRLAKDVHAGRVRLTLTADLFNALNSNTELNRQLNLDSPAFGDLTRNLSPRILRLGLRGSF